MTLPFPNPPTGLTFLPFGLVQQPVNLSTSGDHTIIPANILPIYIFRVILAASSVVNVTFKSGTTPLSGPMPLSVLVLDFSNYPSEPWYTTNAGDGFVMNLDANTPVGGTLWYQIPT